eukprot:TRINITY_DN8125_c0_g1_i1.p1 TRINITY_DN8125_c0_g1~~TRINITY_DN8125_c0_g1_i1.p1  ORF type:complete len:386 (+),score=56.75 TRINITY_DN8125_c0_g1_i1:176-1333(+)
MSTLVVLCRGVRTLTGSHSALTSSACTRYFSRISRDTKPLVRSLHPQQRQLRSNWRPTERSFSVDASDARTRHFRTSTVHSSFLVKGSHPQGRRGGDVPYLAATPTSAFEMHRRSYAGTSSSSKDATKDKEQSSSTTSNRNVDTSSKNPDRRNPGPGQPELSSDPDENIDGENDTDPDAAAGEQPGWEATPAKSFARIGFMTASLTFFIAALTYKFGFEPREQLTQALKDETHETLKKLEAFVLTDEPDHQQQQQQLDVEPPVSMGAFLAFSVSILAGGAAIGYMVATRFANKALASSDGKIRMAKPPKGMAPITKEAAKNAGPKLALAAFVLATAGCLTVMGLGVVAIRVGWDVKTLPEFAQKMRVLLGGDKRIREEGERRRKN